MFEDTDARMREARKSAQSHDRFRRRRVDKATKAEQAGDSERATYWHGEVSDAAARAVGPGLEWVRLAAQTLAQARERFKECKAAEVAAIQARKDAWFATPLNIRQAYGDMPEFRERQSEATRATLLREEARDRLKAADRELTEAVVFVDGLGIVGRANLARTADRDKMWLYRRVSSGQS